MLIVVSGLPRSGTSMMMRMLEAGGIECLYDNEVTKPSQFNPGGYFEHPKGVTGDWEWLRTQDGKAVKIISVLPQMPTDFEVKVIIMRRSLEASVQSSARVGKIDMDKVRTFRQGDLRAIRTWAANKSHIEVWYDDVLESPADEILRVYKLLDIEDLDLAKMALVPDKSLRHI